MNWNVRMLDMVCLAGLILLAIGGSVTGITATHVKAKRVQERNIMMEDSLSKLREAETAVQKIDDALRVNQTALTSLRRRLPASGGVGEFLSGLDVIVTRNAVDLNMVTPGAVTVEPLCKRTPVRISCEGSFASLHEVLYALESMPILVKVDTYSLSKASPDALCKMDASCSVYGQ